MSLRILVAESDEPVFSETASEIRDGIAGATRALEAVGVDMADEPPTEGGLGAQFAQVLVDYPSAGDPCHAPWRDIAGEVEPGEVTVLIGGTIRSKVIEVFFSGYGCPATDVECSDANGPPSGFILVDARLLDGIDPTTFLLHEVGHLAGIDHSDTAGPCGADLVPEGAEGNVMNSGLHGPASAGGDLSAAQVAILKGSRD